MSIGISARRFWLDAVTHFRRRNTHSVSHSRADHSPPPPFTTAVPLSAIGAALGLFTARFALAEPLEASPEESRPALFRNCPSKPACKYLICGAGVAAQAALEEFERAGATGDVVLVSPEWRHLPDRLALDESQGADSKPSSPSSYPLSSKSSTSQQWPASQPSLQSLLFNSGTSNREPEIVIGPSVCHVDVRSRVATLSDGSHLQFERCLLAVGPPSPAPPAGRVISRDATELVGSAISTADWAAVQRTIATTAPSFSRSGPRPHFTVVGGGWMALATTAALLDFGADLTLAYSEPGLLARYLPRYLARELVARLQTASDDGVDLLAYSTVRHIVRRKSLNAQPIIQSPTLVTAPLDTEVGQDTHGPGNMNAVNHSDTTNKVETEAEVHVGTTFDAFAITDFRTDRVMFAPTLCGPTHGGIAVGAGKPTGADGVQVNGELAVGSDVYAAGAIANIEGVPRATRWGRHFADATGRHAARNMLGAREEFEYAARVTVQLDALRLRVTAVGDVNGSDESYGYFLVARDDAARARLGGGRVRRGAIVYMRRGARRRGNSTGMVAPARIVGVAVWQGGVPGSSTPSPSAEEEEEELEEMKGDGAADEDVEEDAKAVWAAVEAGEAAVKLGETARSETEAVCDAIGAAVLGAASETDGSWRVVRRRHVTARAVPIATDEILWSTDGANGTGSSGSQSDRRAAAYSDLLRRAAGAP